MALAGSPAAAGVDLIVGGHSHSLLYGPPPAAPDAGNASDAQLAAQGGAAPPILATPPTKESTAVSGPYPTLVKAADGRVIPVVTAMWASRYLGVLNASWAADGALESAVGAPVLLGGANSTNNVPGEGRPRRCVLVAVAGCGVAAGMQAGRGAGRRAGYVWGAWAWGGSVWPLPAKSTPLTSPCPSPH